MERLAHKSAIVTGAARGIGHAIALRFLAEGATVACVDRDFNGSTGFNQSDGKALQITCDVTDPQQIADMIAQSRSSFGEIDVLVNNAGIGGTGIHLADLELSDWHRMIEGNLTSTFLCCHSVVPVMISQAHRASIINMSSITGVEGTAGSVPYAAAKAGVIGLSKSLAKELAEHSINVNVIAPGLIDTRMSRARGQELAAKAVLLPRIGQPEDIANLALYLASDESEFITGQVFEINGGAHM
jgi:3-oxoacyl-[acyl-carrier protein] reductase